MTPTKLLQRNSRIDWAAYGILAAIGSAILLKMNTALDLLNMHTNQFSSLTTWAHIVAERLSIPFQ